jgi:hypothetical protein
VNGALRTDKLTGYCHSNEQQDIFVCLSPKIEHASLNRDTLSHFASLPHHSFGGLDAFSKILARLIQFQKHLNLLRTAIAQPFQRVNILAQGSLRDLEKFEVRQHDHCPIANFSATAGNAACSKFRIRLSLGASEVRLPDQTMPSIDTTMRRSPPLPALGSGQRARRGTMVAATLSFAVGILCLLSDKTCMF